MKDGEDIAAMVNIHEAKTQLSKLIAAAEAGEDVVIARAGKPAVKLVAVKEPEKKRRVPGRWKDKIWIADDFDAPLPELEESIRKRFDLT